MKGTQYLPDGIKNEGSFQNGLLVQGDKYLPNDIHQWGRFVDNVLICGNIFTYFYDNNQIVKFENHDRRFDPSFITPYCKQYIDFVSGWNWVSFQTFPGEDTSFVRIFGDNLEFVEEIKTQDKSAMFNGTEWIGDLKNFIGIAEGEMYKIKASRPFTIETGDPWATWLEMDQSRTPIYLSKGWNWIAYINSEYECQPVEQALKSIYSDILEIKSAVKGLIRLSDDLMIGNLTTMCPGKGYKIRLKPESQIKYFNYQGQEID